MRPVDGPLALARAIRALPADEPVCVHTAPDAPMGTIALLALRSRSGLNLHWSRGPALPDGGGRGSLGPFTPRSGAVALGETPDDVAHLASAGAEAWLSPFVTLPSDAACREERARWGTTGPRVVLFVGRLDSSLGTALGAAAQSWEASTQALVAWGPGAPTSGHGAAHVEPSTTTSARLITAIAAADVLVVPRGHAYGPRLSAIADQVGTPWVEAPAHAAPSEIDAVIEGALDDQGPRIPAVGAARLAQLTADARGGDEHATGRPAVAVVAWTNSTGRTLEMAQALGGEGRTFYDLNLTDRRLIPLRYLLSSVRTAAYLARTRPRVVVVANPPIIPPVIALAYTKLTGTRLLLDSQTASFGEKDSAIGRLMLPLHRFISKRSTCTLVGAENLAERVRDWGGESMVFHEAPPTWKIAAPRPRGPVLRVLWIGVFASDEPLDALLEAAAMMPEVEFRVTGDLRKAPADRAAAPPNVVWLGFVRGRAFPGELEAADIVITMTTDPASALRGGAEAAFAARPLITTDVPFLRNLFPHAHHTSNDAAEICDAIRSIDGDWPAARAAAAQGVEFQQAGWLPQLGELQRWAGLPSGAPQD